METLTQSSSGDSKIVNANRRGKRGKLPPAMKVNAEITRYEQHTKTVTTAERNTTKTRIPYDNDDSYDDDTTAFTTTSTTKMITGTKKTILAKTMPTIMTLTLSSTE